MRGKVSGASQGCCSSNLALVNFGHMHKDHGACSTTSCPQGGCGFRSGHPPHLQVAIKIVSTAEAPVEFSRKFLPREISSLNATYKHLNVVGRDPRQPGPSYLPQACPFPSWDPYARVGPIPRPQPRAPGGPGWG